MCEALRDVRREEEVNKIEDRLIILGEKRLNIKKHRMKNLLKITSSDEALYREIMLSLGYKNNKAQFLELAMITPYSEIKAFKDAEKIKLALLHRAGFVDATGKLDGFDFSLKMEKSIWNLKHVRPQNHPQKRIEQISYLLTETAMMNGIFNFFRSKIEENYFIDWENTSLINQKIAGKIVKRIMDFQGLGLERKTETFFNIILPFFLVAYEDEKNKNMVEFLITIFEYHKPLALNSIVRDSMKMLNIKKVNSVKEYFGLIQYYYDTKDRIENEES
jgi:hypothetical protein